VFGRPLEERSWDVTARDEFVGTINQRNLRTSVPARTAVHAGHVYVAYRNKSGMLSLDIDESNRSLAGSAPLDPHRLKASAPKQKASRWPFGRRSHLIDFEVPFTGVATIDATVIDGRISPGTTETQPARIVCRADGAWLESRIELGPGSYPLTLSFHGRDVDSGLDLVVGHRGELRLNARKA
jgi:hypothetical protein